MMANTEKLNACWSRQRNRPACWLEVIEDVAPRRRRSGWDRNILGFTIGRLTFADLPVLAYPCPLRANSFLADWPSVQVATVACSFLCDVRTIYGEQSKPQTIASMKLDTRATALLMASSSSVHMNPALTLSRSFSQHKCKPVVSSNGEGVDYLAAFRSEAVQCTIDGRCGTPDLHMTAGRQKLLKSAQRIADLLGAGRPGKVEQCSLKATMQAVFMSISPASGSVITHLSPPLAYGFSLLFQTFMTSRWPQTLL